MFKKNRLPPEAFGTEQNQEEIAKAVYPEPGKIEERDTELPALFDLRAANADKEHIPIIIKDQDSLRQFITQTLKRHRAVELYEFTTISDENIRWVHRPVPEETYDKPFSDIARALADIMARDDRCVGIRIEINKGVHIGLYDGSPDDIEYTGQVRVRYRPIMHSVPSGGPTKY